MSEVDCKKQLSEDFSRITLQQTVTAFERLDVLKDHFGLSGKLGDSVWELLLLVANKYVDGFVVEVGEPRKRGVKKVGDRFKTVTEVEEMKFRRGFTTDQAAIEAVASERRPTIRPPQLTTKYYAYLSEIVANETAAELLNLWRWALQQASATDSLQGFDALFWQCEQDCLGAIVPHNVTKFPTRKN
jgi:hypothetical protein